MPPRLRQDALPGVDQDDGEIGVGGARRHVARVLDMARRVGDDELAAGGREETIGDVDRDALLAFGREPVQQQGEIDRVSGRPVLARILLERRELVVEQELRIVEQPPDQGRFPVIDGAAGEEPQQALCDPLPRIVDGRQRMCWELPSEVALALLLLHRGRLVVVDQPARAFGGSRQHHLVDQVGQRRGGGGNGRRQGIAAERAEPDAQVLRPLSRLERQPVIVDKDQLAAAPDNGTGAAK